MSNGSACETMCSVCSCAPPSAHCFLPFLASVVNTEAGSVPNDNLLTVALVSSELVLGDAGVA